MSKIKHLLPFIPLVLVWEERMEWNEKEQKE